MPEEYNLYQKFTDIAAAEEMARLLKDNGIDYHLQDNLHSYVSVVGYNPVDFAVSLNLKADDFAKADKVLDTYYGDAIKNTDKDYYLFEFTNSELHEIISNPYEWGHFDYQLAKQILKEKGQVVSDKDIRFLKDAKIKELSKLEKVSLGKLVAGYILSVLFPFGGIFIGITIVYNRNTLPNGQKFYVHTADERRHGQIIISISIIWVCVILFTSWLKSA
jgi:ABC-type transport system substrate-binding protein